jgi:lipoprotein-anchoring transpeptidase ErfK/SrfK
MMNARTEDATRSPSILVYGILAVLGMLLLFELVGSLPPAGSAAALAAGNPPAAVQFVPRMLKDKPLGPLSTSRKPAMPAPARSGETRSLRVQPPAPPVAYEPDPAFMLPPAAPGEIEEARWIDVDLSEQLLSVYEGRRIVRTMSVSTGLPGTPTPEGRFRIWVRMRYDDMEGPDYFLADVPYTMYFYMGYGLHAATWHNNFGHPMSHGCVNLSLTDAEWLFNWAEVGTLVNVHQ